MKKNTFYLICGAVVLALLFLFYLSVELKMPGIIFLGILVAVVLYAVCKKKIADTLFDERQMFIDMKTASATLKGAAVLYLAVNIPLAVYAFRFPQLVTQSAPMSPVLSPTISAAPTSISLATPIAQGTSIPLMTLGSVALVELTLLAVVLFIYVGFHIYYAKKFGGYEGDEE